MTENQKSFLELAVIKQWKYDQISAELGIARKTFTVWWEELKAERELLSKYWNFMKGIN